VLNLAPWDLDTPSSTGASSDTPSSASPKKGPSPNKGNKIDRQIVAALPKPKAHRTACEESGSGPSRPKRSAKANAAHASEPASVPLTPSFRDSQFDRTPSFETEDAMGQSFSDLIRKTAVFGDGDKMNAPTDPRQLIRASSHASSEDRSRSSPTKDPNRRARIEETPCDSIDCCPSKDANKKVGNLASLAMRSPLVRLIRIQDLALADRSLLGTKVQSFAKLGKRLHEQRALSSIWTLDSLDAGALVMWYLPYCVLTMLYVLVILVAGALSETLLVSVPLFVLLPVLHLARLGLCERSLHSAVDDGALAEFNDQLQSPMGCNGNGVFAMTLSGALQAFQKPFPRLLARPPARLPLRSVVLCFYCACLLAIVRMLRLTGVASWVEVEAGITFVAMAVVVFAGCSPTGLRDRVKEADVRLTALEAAFNTMLDTLRPLMGDLHGGVAPPPVPTSPTNMLAACTRFSVRLISKDRNTLRANLHVFCKDVPQLFVHCPLANFTILSGSLDSVAPTELGLNASSPAVFAGGRTSLSPGMGQGLNAVAATMGINLGERRQRRREDDEYSTSLASCSTASTSRSKKINYQPSEASLRMAMGMVTTVCARQNEPLEAFRPTSSGAVIPAKAPVDEPSLLLALEADSVQIIAGFDPRSLDPSEASSWHPGLVASLEALLPLLKSEAPIAGAGSFGVLRDSDEMERLCRGGDVDTPSLWPSLPLGRLSSDCSDSEGSAAMSDEDDERRIPRSIPAESYLKEASSSSRHLAVLFDSVAERDRCLELFGVAGLLSEPNPDWP